MYKMKKYLFFLLMAFTLLPMAGFAQDEEAVDYDAYIADLNARCPIDYEGGWMITSFAVKGDTTCVEVETPSVLSGFLPMLTANTENVKRMWLNQLSQYGDSWKRFAEMMVAANRSLALILRPKGSEVSAVVTFIPSDFNQQ